MNKLAIQLKQSGIKTIKGDIIADDSWFDGVRYSIDLPWSDEQNYYGAQISALTLSPDKDFDAGTVIIEVLPAKQIEEKATISVQPNNNYVKIVNKVKTVSADSKEDILIERKHGTNTIIIKGDMPVGSKSTREWISVWEPTNYVLELFKQSLQEHGVKLKGKPRVGKAPNEITKLYTHHSMPLSELLIPFMKLSNNGHAESLVKELGKVSTGEGSWEKGLEIVKQELANLGVNTDTLVLRDGSGISHVNLVPANEISRLLYEVQKEPWFPVFLQSFPVSGSKEKLLGGTLRYRMTESPSVGKVIAKTGTISTVSSLSGYIDTKSGERYIFSILLNNLVDDKRGKEIEDQICTILLNH